MTKSILDALWPIAKLEGFRDRGDLERLDLRGVEFGTNGRLIVPPMLFDQARAQSPSLFKRASEMTAAERADFVSNASRKQRALIDRAVWSKFPPARPGVPIPALHSRRHT
jgi:hypothetical protein